MIRSNAARPSERDSCVPAGFTIVLFAFIAATRWLLAPKYLYYFDSANFAFSLEHFNPALHQPQPPGYPLFVLFIRFIHLFVAPAERVLLLAGILGSLAAVLLILAFARDVFGGTAGLLAAALLASDPVFWFGGLSNQIRIFLAVCGLGIGWLAWRALTRPHQPGWLYAAFAAIGIGGGFRPEIAVLLAPLVIWVWWQTSRLPRHFAVGTALLALCVLPWLGFTIWTVGGPAEFLRICREYSDSQFGGSSIFFGATARAAYHMFAEATVWTSLGALVWLWAVPFAGKHLRWNGPRHAPAFLALAFLPTFLFSSLIHIGDPDQALAGVAFLSVLGGGVLSAVLARWDVRHVYGAAAAVIALHTVTFFYPPGKLARVSSYKAVAAVDRMTRAAIDSVRELRGSGPLTIVHYGSPVASRELSYYFPDAYVVVLPGPGHAPGEGPQVFYRHRTLSANTDPTVRLPSTTTYVVCLRSTIPRESARWQKDGPLYLRKWTSGRPIAIGEFTLIPENAVTGTLHPSSRM